MGWSKFSRKIKSVVGGDSIVISKGRIFYQNKDGRQDFLFSKELYESLLETAEIKSFKNNILCKKESVEILVNRVNDAVKRGFHYSYDSVNNHLNESKQSFFDMVQIQYPSIEFLINSFENNALLTANPIAKYYLDRVFRGRELDEDDIATNKTSNEILGGFLAFILDISACLVVSRKRNGRSLQINTILDNCDSLLMYLAMNYSVALKLGSDKSFLRRRGFTPRIGYNMPIIKCSDVFVAEKYVQAVATNSYDTQYLYFYQIVERISQKMAPALFITEIRDVISASKKTTDYDKFIDLKNKITGDNEQQLLEKLIRSKIAVTTVIPLLRTSQIDYFGRNLPRFIRQKNEALINFGNQIDFARTLSKRIYWIRNAIVHAKEENFKKKAKETPFDWATDGESLVPEIALLKLIVDYSIKIYSASKCCK